MEREPDGASDRPAISEEIRKNIEQHVCLAMMHVITSCVQTMDVTMQAQLRALFQISETAAERLAARNNPVPPAGPPTQPREDRERVDP